jgi:uncharacterized protein YkwD
VVAITTGAVQFKAHASASSADLAGQVSDKPLTASAHATKDHPAKVRFNAVPAAPSELYNHGDPTAEEQLMLELVNRARANPTAEAARFGIDLNEGITTNLIPSTPTQPLAFDPHTLQSARGHSQWMLDHDMFGHVETDGSDPGDRMQAAGYVFSGFYSWGENIAWRGGGAPLPVGPTVVAEHQDLFVDKGVTDRGHRRDLLASDFREIGIGVKTGIFTQNGFGYNAVMVTQDFASSDANPGPFLVGVVYRDSNGDGSYGVGEGLAGVTVLPASGAFYAVSSASGGYAIPVTGLSGMLQVTFSGGLLARPVTKSIALTGQNVKLNFEYNSDTALALGFVASSAKSLVPGQFQVDLQGPANARVSIQMSEDLRTWTEIGQITLSATPSHFNDSAGHRGQRFYRAVRL